MKFLEEHLEISDGTLVLPDRPGLGSTIDEERLERYRVDG